MNKPMNIKPLTTIETGSRKATCMRIIRYIYMLTDNHLSPTEIN